MGKTWKIFKREFFSRIRSKSFIAMTILGPLFLAAVLVVPLLIEKYEQNREKRVAIIDESNLLGQTIRDFESYKFMILTDVTVDEISKDFANSGFDAVLFIPNNIYSSNSVIIYSNVWIDNALKAYVGYALRPRERLTIQSRKVYRLGVCLLVAVMLPQGVRHGSVGAYG